MSEDITQDIPNDNTRLILARFDSIDSRLDRIDSRLDGVEGRLTTLEDKVDKRLVETRPIWERALAEITETRVEMNERFEKLDSEIGKLRTDMEDGLYRVKGQIDVLNANILDVRTDMRHLDKRVTKLEAEPAK